MALKPSSFSFGTNHPAFSGQMAKPTPPATAGMDSPMGPGPNAPNQSWARPVVPPTLPLPAPVMFPPAQPQPAAPAGMPPANAPRGGDPVADFLKNILGPFIQQQGQQQGQQNVANNQFRNDAAFGRRLGMDGRPEQAPLPIEGRSPTDVIARERATFGGQSFTVGDRSAPQGSAWANMQPGPQHFSTNYTPDQSAPQTTWGSPVYRAQNPNFNMFSDANFEQQNVAQNPMPQRAYATFNDPAAARHIQGMGWNMFPR